MERSADIFVKTILAKQQEEIERLKQEFKSLKGKVEELQKLNIVTTKHETIFKMIMGQGGSFFEGVNVAIQGFQDVENSVSTQKAKQTDTPVPVVQNETAMEDEGDVSSTLSTTAVVGTIRGSKDGISNHSHGPIIGNGSRNGDTTGLGGRKNNYNNERVPIPTSRSSDDFNVENHAATAMRRALNSKQKGAKEITPGDWFMHEDRSWKQYNLDKYSFNRQNKFFNRCGIKYSQNHSMDRDHGHQTQLKYRESNDSNKPHQFYSKKYDTTVYRKRDFHGSDKNGCWKNTSRNSRAWSCLESTKSSQGTAENSDDESSVMKDEVVGPSNMEKYEEIFRCPVPLCEFMSYKREHTENHYEYAHAFYKCAMCKEQYGIRASLRNHLMLRHQIESQDVEFYLN